MKIKSWLSMSKASGPINKQNRSEKHLKKKKRKDRSIQQLYTY